MYSRKKLDTCSVLKRIGNNWGFMSAFTSDTCRDKSEHFMANYLINFFTEITFMAFSFAPELTNYKLKAF